MASGKSEAVEAPAAIDHTDLREHPGVRVLAGLGVLLLQVEETLLRRATRIGTEDDLPSERLGPRQRMDVHKEGVIHAIELDGLAHGRIDDSRVTQYGSLMPADLVEAVELPGYGGRCRGGRRFARVRDQVQPG